jgi:hypothetical protein
MQDKNGSDSGYQVPGTGYLAPLPHSRISNLNKAVAYAVMPRYPVVPAFVEIVITASL